MKIAYLIFEDVINHSGLKQKIDSQIARWERNGHVVYRVYGKQYTVEPSVDLNLSQSSFLKGKLGALLSKAKEYAFVRMALMKIRPDLVYSRYLFPMWGVHKIKPDGAKFIIEINSDDKNEYFNKSFLIGAWNAVFRRCVLQLADGFVYVTNELMRAKNFKNFSCARTVIANGINCQDFVLTHPKNKTPQLALIGSPNQNWHGFDKLFALAKILPNVQIHVIGPDESECIKSWNIIPNNITIHGYLTANEAKKVLSEIDVAISTLALHRKAMDEACPLKVRQYFALGIPVLAASNDPDLIQPQDFYYQIPNCENNITSYKEGIKQFVDYAFNNKELRLKVRKYAELHFDVVEKENKRLNFFNKVLAET